MILPDNELKKAQSLMLKILKEVHRVCEENNIKYFLSDGTLIGAVRHNGFIPWDDDLDIGMVRSEYEKFCRIAPQKLGDEYIIQSHSTDKGFALPYIKIILKDTVWMEKASEKTNRKYIGLYIDVFPYDKVPLDKKVQEKHRRKYAFIKHLLYIKLRYKLLKDVKSLPRKIYFILKAFIALFIPVETLVKKRDALCIKFEGLEKDYVLTKYGGNFYKNQNPFDSFYNTELHVFENEQFYIPKDYDSVLTNLYGNYMQLPPPEKRLNHGIEYYDFGKYNVTQ